MPGPRHADREPAGVPCATLINHILGSQKENDMKITKNRLETTPGPSDWFTGAVYIDTVAAPSNGSRLSASSVHFTPGARTAWHTHPNGQTIYVTEGVGLCQRRGAHTLHDPLRDPRRGRPPPRRNTHRKTTRLHS